MSHRTSFQPMFMAHIREGQPECLVPYTIEHAIWGGVQGQDKYQVWLVPIHKWHLAVRLDVLTRLKSSTQRRYACGFNLAAAASEPHSTISGWARI